ncbi:hypothetical protein [Streptacidiphilus jiangxiensis]|uniref:Uncharacterized protein n=1 Tax=Streptacidiphilus jiangxiensis TaxID=235985 RepID=A0A1H7F2Q0_STRJI|nr:hypothetical protein [Streptacidiphilus jiangxiensis]SEK20393.1 hypothetical protein SAMN05414137_10160 [Streptacidiphilus jiangxiensis]
MGIESEQLVYDYLSRVGDIAGRSGGLTAAQRARLVNELRQTIDSQRAANSSSSVRAEVGAVRRILAGLGTPDEVVARASGGAMWPTAGPSVPAQSRSATATMPGTTSGATPMIPSQAQPPAVEGRVEFVSADAGRQPLTGGVPLWSAEPESGDYPGANGVRMVQLPGWSGTFDGAPPTWDPSGVIHPLTGLPVAPPAGVPGEVPFPGAGAPFVAQPRPGLLRRLLGASATAPAPAGAVAEPVAAVPRAPIPFVEAVATLVLAAGAVTGFWYVAILGWLFAYGGRRLGRGVGRFAALWIPGLTAAACGFWLYRTGHPAGHPALTNAQFATATHNAFAFWLRAASALSAAFLAWRITRR